MYAFFSRLIRSNPIEIVSLYAVYSEILGKLYLLGIAFTLAYTQSVYIEWGLGNPINLSLSAAELVIGILFILISLFFRKFFTFAPLLVRVLFFLLVVLEIETGFHDPKIIYFDPRNWLTIIALIGVSSFFYPGRVWQFVLEWSILFLIYILRVIIENQGKIPEETWREMTTIIPLFFVCFFLNHWWFRTRYIAAYRGVLLNERKKSFFQDVHDSLGSHLTEILLLTRKLETNAPIESLEDFKKLKNTSEEAMGLLRSQLHEEDQKEILRTSFLDGIRLLLKKRYKFAGRNIKFQWDEKWNEINIRLTDKEIVKNLYFIFSEITTNDLKYGKGTSVWKLSIEPKSFWFHFSTTGNDDLDAEIIFPDEDDSHENNLISKVESIGGTLSISKNPYTIQMIVPARWFTWIE